MNRGLELRVVESSRSPEGRAFIELPFSLYRGCPQWVPWFRADVGRLLDRRHPYFEHSAAEFFIVRRGRQTMGRIMVLENTRSNAQHGRRFAYFHLFDAAEDPEAAGALLEAAEGWARRRNLETLAGPGGLGASLGSGILVEGFEHRAAMTMMAYNHPYYPKLLEQAGYRTNQNLFSFHLNAETFQLPERVREIAEKVLARESFRVLDFRTKRELLAVAPKLGQIFNAAIGEDHPEAYPYSEREVKQVIRELTLVADPSLIKILAYRGEIVGFVFGFPDLSAALQRSGGRLNPLTILDLLLEYRRTTGLIINGAGILPRYQRLGGNALLYYALERTARGRAASLPPFRDVDLTQIAETTPLMLSDIQSLGARLYKTHRVYRRDL